MSEEEKKAYDNLIMLKYFTLEKEDKKAIQIILDLIEKQQKEIEEWQKAYIKENNYWLKFRNKINKIANNDKDCSDNEVIKAVKNLNKENDKLTKLLLGKSLGFNDYISKNKIRKEKEEIEEMLLKEKNKNTKIEFSYAIGVLEELLEE